MCCAGGGERGVYGKRWQQRREGDGREEDGRREGRDQDEKNQGKKDLVVMYRIFQFVFRKLVCAKQSRKFRKITEKFKFWARKQQWFKQFDSV